MAEPAQRTRLDKWLWYARFFKTRSLSAKCVSSGHCRVNGARAAKPSHAVGTGDVLTFAQGRNVRVIRIEAVGTRRGPAPEAQALYTDLDPPKAKGPTEDALVPPTRTGRPTKQDRRAIARFQGKDL